MTEGATTVALTKNQKKRMKKKSAEKKHLHARGDYVFDVSYLDAHHLAIIACLDTLPCAIPHRASDITEPGVDSLGIFVGLGGGSLVMGLQHHYPSGSLLVCDLDDYMETLATKFFGFSKQRRTHVFAQEGVEFLGHIYQQAGVLSRDESEGPSAATGDDPGMKHPLRCAPLAYDFYFPYRFIEPCSPRIQHHPIPRSCTRPSHHCTPLSLRRFVYRHRCGRQGSVAETHSPARCLHCGVDSATDAQPVSPGRSTGHQHRRKRR